MGIENINTETRILIDNELRLIAAINCKIGRDTKVDEKIEYRKQIGVCMKNIKALDLGFWEEICPDKRDKI